MSDHFDVAQLLALPMQPCIRVKIGPGQFLDVSQVAWEAQKDAFQEWALGLPNIHQGIGFHALKPFTGGNGMLARLVVSLGDLAGVWKMYPSPNAGDVLWGRMHPSIRMEPVHRRKTLRTVPKPSAGDLEPTKVCPCCSRGMGPPDSIIHDLQESDETEGICLECDITCGPGAESCEITGQKEKTAAEPPRPVQEEFESPEVLNDRLVMFEDYAKQFGD